MLLLLLRIIFSSMRIVLCRVKEASVKIEGEIVGAIKEGYLLLTGFSMSDTPYLCEKMAEKIHKLRIFEDDKGKTNLSIDAYKGNVLSISQFTLYGSVKEGNRPSFIAAREAKSANELYEYFNACLRKYFPHLQVGSFGANMQVSSINDGPFTLILDSDELFKEAK